MLLKALQMKKKKKNCKPATICYPRDLRVLLVPSSFALVLLRCPVTTNNRSRELVRRTASLPAQGLKRVADVELFRELRDARTINDRVWD